jgi:hypothetical protein
MQVDWAHFKSLSYGGFTRKLYALCVIECYSRMLYVGFTHNMKQEALHQELMNAFRFFGGCPRELVVDNMRCAVAERTGRYVRFNDAFLDFLRPLGIDPISCNIRSPHEKGKIENAVKYLRYNFFPARTFKDIADVRRQAMGWLRNTANVRVHYTTGMRPVDRFDPKALKSLPDVLPDCRETVTVLVHKDFGVRFDSNVYTAPPWTIGKRLTLKADMESIALYYKDRLIAEHQRCWEKKRRIVHPRHEQQVKKFHSRLLKKRDVIVFLSLGQIAADYLEKLFSANKPIEKSVSKLLALKDEYGEAGLRFALEKALLKNLIGVDYIENILYQEMTPEVRHPPVILKDETLNDIRLTSPSLAEYDAVALQRKRNDDRSGD